MEKLEGRKEKKWNADTSTSSVTMTLMIMIKYDLNEDADKRKTQIPNLKFQIPKGGHGLTRIIRIKNRTLMTLM